jgi:hypothetical protein
MKDFLIGRPSVASTRSGSQNIQLPSNLPPISAGISTGEPPLEDLANSLESQTNAPSHSEACATEPKVEILPDAEGRVGHIVVTCRCGEKITLQCNY